MATIDFDDLVGEEFDFYGADEAEQRFRLDGVTYDVINDEYSDCHGLVSSHELQGLPLARVTIEADDAIYKIVDLHDGYEWLQFGVYHDYYHGYCDFVFEYFPKEVEE